MKLNWFKFVNDSHIKRPIIITFLLILVTSCSLNSSKDEIKQAKILIKGLDEQIFKNLFSDELYFRRAKLKYYIKERKSSIRDLDMAITINKNNSEYYFFFPSTKFCILFFFFQFVHCSNLEQ